MRMLRLLVVLAMVGAVQPASAAMVFRTALLTKVSSENTATAPNRAQYQSIFSVAQNAPWASTTNCDATWAYFNESENPQFVAMLLAARLSGTPVEIVVDDSLPRIDNLCKIINIGI